MGSGELLIRDPSCIGHRSRWEDRCADPELLISRPEVADVKWGCEDQSRGRERTVSKRVSWRARKSDE